MKKVISAVICSVLYLIIALFGVARLIDDRVIQGIVVGILAAFFWGIFIKINKK